MMTANPLPAEVLDPQTLGDIIDLALWAGQLLLQNGAQSARIEETVHRLGTGMGANWMDILVSPNAIVATTSSGDIFRTKVRRVTVIGVNMQVIDAVNTISRRVAAGELDRHQVRAELERASSLPPQFTGWQVALMAGLSCAAFSQLFGGDWPVFAVTFIAAAAAMTVRRYLTRRQFNGLLVVIATAFVAGMIASAAVILNLSPRPQIALIASVLLLVPGVPLINSAEDLIKGHMVTGLTRGLSGALITLGIALGLLFAIRLMGITGL